VCPVAHQKESGYLPCSFPLRSGTALRYRL
jgi:hypothetical protein